MIPLKEVKSSMLQAFGYQPTTGILAIRFSENKVYLYKDVPQEVADAFAAHQSAGAAFGSMIRGKFEHTVVLDEDCDQPA